MCQALYSAQEIQQSTGSQVPASTASILGEELGGESQKNYWEIISVAYVAEYKV